MCRVAWTTGCVPHLRIDYAGLGEMLGAHYFGQLGDGTRINRSTPVDVQLQF